MGSPALAAYSILLTSLNARLVYLRAQHTKHENRTAVARVLITFQQTPLELTKDERLLAFIPINDQWRREIVDRLNRRNAWSIATGSPVLWVVVAFTLTLVDSFLSLDNPTNGASEGHAVGTLWLWLLCLVIGWWWVPTFTYGGLKSAIGHANRRKAKKAAKGTKQKAAKITSRLPEGMSILKGLRKPVVNLPQVFEENVNERVGEGSIQEVDIEPVGQETEPIAYSPPWSIQSLTEGQQDHGHLNAGLNPTANQSAVSLSRSAAVYSITAQSEILPETDRLLIPKGGSDSLNRDELRLAAMFNYSRIMRYLVLVDDVLRALDEPTHEKDEVGL